MGRGRALLRTIDLIDLADLVGQLSGNSDAGPLGGM
jgi:hypothetical protein